MDVRNGHRVVVLGAGYAGMAAAVQLAARLRKRDGVRVSVVNGSEVFTERMRLHQAGTGWAPAGHRIPDALAGTGAEFVRARVTAVDAAARLVRTEAGTALSYDTLVYALGSVTDTTEVPGAADHAFALDGPAEAALLAARLDALAEGTVVVAGTGLTGIETAAEIAERHPRLGVVLLGRQEPGAGMHPRARKHLQDALARLGVEVRTGEAVKVLPDAVVLADGTEVPSDAVVWTGGTRVAPLAEAAGFAVDGRGRIVTDAALRSVSHPEVYAVGDAAAVRQNYGMMHGTCQSGMPTGVHAALSIVRSLGGRAPEPFRFGYFHIPVSLGRADAVVQFTRPDGTPRSAFLTGRAAVRYKETVIASPWPTFLRMRRMPASGAFWTRGGRATRGVR
ncbi:NADH dehydrogenase FAD-containing subunit [Actinocorallia herbida]|uniref:NADH dehydrogenase FAD-containing subunit n=1 Tax=Actinocorallia herbida TaxID=58109 RepID=A0A3N1D3V8_9ACTN|nr:FAD-dependent oxidoreductase [Actinocorallia herbida]ROO88189.1 NADH dehydrogenase FAD-containing subunit [Actinocorallia herbida]